MPIANPLVQGPPVGGFETPPPTDRDSGDAGDTVYAAGGAGASVGGVQATAGGSLTGPHNTSAQVGVLVLGALAVIVLLHIGGFRFAVDAGLTGR